MNAIFIFKKQLKLFFISVPCLHKLSSNGGCFQTINILDLGAGEVCGYIDTITCSFILFFFLILFYYFATLNELQAELKG